MQIRTYQPKDYEDIINLWLDAGLMLTLSDIKEELDRFVRHCPDSFFLLEQDEHLIGSVIASFDGRRGYIYHLAVHPDFQGRGLGSKLMEKVESWYRSNNVVKIHLMIEKSNTGVRGFYEKIGWHCRDDLIMMSKSLRTEEFTILGVTTRDDYITRSDF